MFGLSKEEMGVLSKLSSPIKIQDYLDTLPINYEKRGETHMSPRMVLREKKAHCIEGALLAATALWIQGEKPLIMDLTAGADDDDHVVALYKQNGYWGAISKTNHPLLRFRDPIYKTLRELALTYFHEWFLNESGKKMLVSYSIPINMERFDKSWITDEKDLWYIDEALDNAPHFELVPKQNKKLIRNADTFERKIGTETEWKKSDKRT
ncbi:hypothetical protein EPO56_00505 [Patescibacteria group bacterium]|nr:MAG: hypothetical protein EPO56_00505 [Patescibacteria group bacterium]